MPTPQREPLRAITAIEQAALERIVSADTERVDQVRRAAAVLAVHCGQPYIPQPQESWSASAVNADSFAYNWRTHTAEAPGPLRPPAVVPGPASRQQSHLAEPDSVLTQLADAVADRRGEPLDQHHQQIHQDEQRGHLAILEQVHRRKDQKPDATRADKPEYGRRSHVFIQPI
jgi:hypothetical protein